MQYVFILGRNPELSQAEIESYLNNRNIRYSFVDNTKEFLILEMDEINPKKILSALGGTIKIGAILDSVDNMGEVSIKEERKILSYLPVEEKKIFFGFSLYGCREKDKEKFQKIGLEIKKELKKQGHSSRLVISKEVALSSVVVKKNKLLSRGKDFLILCGQKAYLGETLVIQEFEEYGERDYGRPGRDSRSGMLPPKLAKMMINLAQAKEEDVILDSFCGSGTILSEAMILGYKNLIGTDSNSRAIIDSKKNMSWTISNYFAEPEVFTNYKFQELDVRKLATKISVNSIDKIITEPYLGPPLRGGESEMQIKQIINELSELYFDAFGEFKKILKSGGRIVMVFPIFKYDGKSLSLGIKDKIKKLGFQEKNILSDKRLIYSRPDQRVIREITIWEK